MHKRIPFSALLVIFALLWQIHPGFTQPQIVETSVDYVFAEQITFRAILQTESGVESAMIFFQDYPNAHTNLGLATVTPLNANTYELEYTFHLENYTLRPFSNVEYRFEITLSGGEVYKSSPSTFFYEDNRQQWRILEEKPFQVHWYEGDIAFAQSILDAAQQGLTRAQSLLTLPSVEKLDIYVYADPRLMQTVLSPSNSDWVAGHADPNLSVIVVAIPKGPEQSLLIDQRIPHELMHILLYQLTTSGYENLPAWLNEGLASQAELYPNPDYRILLESAVQKDSLLPISSLCETFPRDASNALLSYAQSASFTSYLYDAYGATAMQELIAAYANGLDCQRGVATTFGMELNQIERNWQRDVLAQNILANALENLLPWLVLLAVILGVPFALILIRQRLASKSQAGK